MSTTSPLAEILQLSVDERIKLATEIWDSIAAVPEAVTLSDSQREELDRRLVAYEKNPDEGTPLRKHLGLA